jgi:spatacsin
MLISGEMDDGPTVLQLYKWEKSQPYLDLSKFREASISPTRRLFGLLSDHGESLLLSYNVLLFLGSSSSSLCSYFFY